jgi:glucokinase
MTPSSFAIGVDIGGTKVAVGAVDDTGKVIAETSIPTDTRITPNTMTERIIQTIHEIISGKRLDIRHCQGIGIGAPGPLDPRGGKIVCPPNLPNWRDFPIVRQFEQEFDLPIRLENDASAAAVAEKWAGAAQDSNNFIYITISTGIGAGLYLDGKLYTGASGNAGDIGHMVIDPSQGTCTCGQKGCFEYVASGSAIARIGSAKLGRAVSTREVFDLYAQGDERAVHLLEQVFEYIGMGCVSLINAYDPEKIVIGGGVSQTGKPLFEAVQEYVGKYALNPSGRLTSIVPTGLSTSTGLIGAAALVYEA